MPVHVSSTCAHHQEVKIALHSLWYHHTYRCDDTRIQTRFEPLWVILGECRSKLIQNLVYKENKLKLY